jgi:hypothetical protein
LIGNDTLITDNAKGDQKQLWPDSIGSNSYWYSVLDGVMLLRALRKDKLLYNIDSAHSFPLPGNDVLAAVRENASGIFIADPYERRNFQTSLNDDIKSMVGSHIGELLAYNNPWSSMPRLLILPILSGLHWRFVTIKIDYSASKAYITWDDPYGAAHFPKALKDTLLAGINSNIEKLFQAQKKQSDLSVGKISIIETTRSNDLQGAGNNAWDCGPIVFQCISDWVGAFLANREVVLTIRLANDRQHYRQLQEIRKRDCLVYRQISGLGGSDISDAIHAKVSDIVASYAIGQQVKLAAYSQDPDGLLTDPYAAGIFHAYIENGRIKSKEDISKPYTNREQQQAYGYVKKLKEEDKKQRYAEIEKVQKSKLSSGLSHPFTWHVRRHFDGILKKATTLDSETLKEYLIAFTQEVTKLSEEGRFDQTELDTRTIFLKRLREHILRKMAFQLSERTDYDKDRENYEALNVLDSNYVRSLEKYYRYTEKDHFAHTMNCFSPGLEKPSTFALLTSVDLYLLQDIEDTLWQIHLKELLLDTLQSAISQEGRYLWIYRFFEGALPQYLLNYEGLTAPDDINDQMNTLLRELGLEDKVNKLRAMEQELTTTHIPYAAQEIQELEEEKPGSYATMLYALYVEHENINLRNEGFSPEWRRERKVKLVECLNHYGFVSGWKAINKPASQPSIPVMRRELQQEINQHLKRYREDLKSNGFQADEYRLQFYAETLSNRENDRIRDIESFYDKQYEEYREECQRLDDDPDSAEWDYDGPIYPSTPPEYPLINAFYTHSSNFLPEGHSPSALIKFYKEDSCGLVQPYSLVQACGGNNKLKVIAHQYAEYDMEIFEEVLDAVDCEQLGLDRDIGAYILRKTFLDHDYYPNEILEGRFTYKVFARFTDELLTKNEDAPADSFDLPSLKQFAEDIQSNFVQAYEKGYLKDLQMRFNDAYYRHDWVEVQKLWPVFTKFQCLLNSTEEYRKISEKHPGFRPQTKGSHFALENRPTDYQDLLDKAWKSYETRANDHYYRVYLSHDTHTLKYSSARHPEKDTSISLIDLLGELESVGRTIGSTLKENGDKGTNIITPILCFVVTDKPHKKDGGHKRIFIPVSLEFSSEDKKHLHSKDYQDGTFTIPDEAVKDEYLKQQANISYQAGATIMKRGNGIETDISLDKNEKLYHSERVLLESLGKQENIDQIVRLLEQELKKYIRQDLESGKYKVYAVALLTYSTNSICNYCTPSLIALQNSHADGFLKALSQALNAHPSFKTRGFCRETNVQLSTKFPMLTIAATDAPWSEQAHELAEPPKANASTPKDSRTMNNPKGLIHLEENTVDLHTPSFDNKGVMYDRQHCFIEFVDANFSQKAEKSSSSRPFIYTGLSFMSGSKQAKFGERVRELDQKLTEVMSIQQQRKEEVDQSWVSRHKGSKKK